MPATWSLPYKFYLSASLLNGIDTSHFFLSLGNRVFRTTNWFRNNLRFTELADINQLFPIFRCHFDVFLPFYTVFRSSFYQLLLSYGIQVVCWLLKLLRLSFYLKDIRFDFVLLKKKFSQIWHIFDLFLIVSPTFFR